MQDISIIRILSEYYLPTTAGNLAVQSIFIVRSLEGVARICCNKLRICLRNIFQAENSSKISRIKILFYNNKRFSWSRKENV